MAEQSTQRWAAMAQAACEGLSGWRARHPQATFREIELAVDEELARVRARLLADLAVASRASEFTTGQRCSGCGEELADGGKRGRTLTTTHDQPVELHRTYAVCPTCGEGVFPPG